MSDHDHARESTARHAAAFRRLHHDRAGFVMPNAWDAGSARLALMPAHRSNSFRNNGL